jgi:hypothetical protein
LPPAGVAGIQKVPQPSFRPSSISRSARRASSKRQESDRDQPPIVLAEIRNGAVHRARATIQQIEVILDLIEGASELRQRNRNENQLPVEAEQIERARPFDRIEGAQRRPAP